MTLSQYKEQIITYFRESLLKYKQPEALFFNFQDKAEIEDHPHQFISGKQNVVSVLITPILRISTIFRKKK